MKKNKKGLTLIELIFSIVLLTVILLFLYALINNVLFKEDNSKFDNSVNAALIIENANEDLLKYGMAYNKGDIDKLLFEKQEVEGVGVVYTLNTLNGYSKLAITELEGSNEVKQYKIKYKDTNQKEYLLELDEDFYVEYSDIKDPTPQYIDESNVIFTLNIPVYSRDGNKNTRKNNDYKDDIIIEYYGKVSEKEEITEEELVQIKTPTLTTNDGIGTGELHSKGNLKITAKNSGKNVTYIWYNSGNNRIDTGINQTCNDSDCESVYTYGSTDTKDPNGVIIKVRACNDEAVCSDYTSYNIKYLSAPPTPEIKADDKKVSGQEHDKNFKLTATSSDVDLFEWYIGDDLVSSELTEGKNDSTISVTKETKETKYEVHACKQNPYSTSDYVCSDKKSYVVVLEKTKAPNNPTITASDGKASGKERDTDVTLTANSSHQTLSKDKIKYYWYDGDNNSISNEQKITLSGKMNETYRVKACVEVDGVNRCSEKVSYKVVIVPPIPKYPPAKPTVKASDGVLSGYNHTSPFSLTAASSDATEYKWRIGTSSSIISTKNTITFDKEMDKTKYYVKACNKVGCSSEVLYEVYYKVPKKPKVPTITADDGIKSGEKHTKSFNLTANSSGANLYKWSGTGCPTDKKQTVKIVDETTGKICNVKACNVVDNLEKCSENASYKIVLELISKPEGTATIMASDGIASGKKHTNNFKLTASHPDASYYKWNKSTSTKSTIDISEDTTQTTYTVQPCNTKGCGDKSSYVVVLDKKSAPINVKITASDGIASGKKHTKDFKLTASSSGADYYKWTGGSTSSNKTITVSSDTTGTTYTVKACNNSIFGDKCTSASYKVILDKKSAPTNVKITASDGIACGKKHTKDFKLTVSSSGADYYKWTSGSTSSDATITVSKETAGTVYKVKACNKSVHGDKCSEASCKVILDKTTAPAVPSITASDGIKTGKWHTANFTLKASSSGANYYQWSGCSSVKGQSITWSSNTTTSGKICNVKACKTSVNGDKCSANASYQVLMDNRTPTTPTIKASDGIASNNWHKANFKLTASSSNAVSYKWSGCSTSSTNSVSISSNTSSSKCTVKACNNAGQSSGKCATASYTVKLDKNAPSCSIAFKLGSASGSNYTSGWTNKKVYIKTTCSDNYTSSSNISVKLSSNTSSINTSEKSINSTGEHKVTANATDAAGNKSAVSSTVKIDKTKPSCTLHLTTGNYKSNGGKKYTSGSNTRDNVYAELQCSDSHSGISSSGIILNNKKTSYVKLKITNKATVSFFAKDKAGNEASGSTQEIKILSCKTVDNGYTKNCNASNTVTKTVTCSGSYTLKTTYTANTTNYKYFWDNATTKSFTSKHDTGVSSCNYSNLGKYNYTWLETTTTSKTCVKCLKGGTRYLPKCNTPSKNRCTEYSYTYSYKYRRVTCKREISSYSNYSSSSSYVSAGSCSASGYAGGYSKYVTCSTGYKKKKTTTCS